MDEEKIRQIIREQIYKVVDNIDKNYMLMDVVDEMEYDAEDMDFDEEEIAEWIEEEIDRARVYFTEED